MKKIGIIGCGWLGKKLANRLANDCELFVTTGRKETAEELSQLHYTAKAVRFSDKKIAIQSSWEIINSLDTIAILIPLSMRRSSPEEVNNKIQNLFSFIGNYRGQLLFASSTGVYPRKPALFKEEDLPIKENFIEHMIKEHYPQTNILRLGGLMGDDRLLSKYQISNQHEPVNHIHYSDVCSLIIKMINEQSQGKLYNVVAPLHPSKEDVISAQKGHNILSKEGPVGRIISSSKLLNEMKFEFDYPDPRTFHL